MNAQGEHIVVIVEGVLHAVAMMGVDVDVGDPAQAKFLPDHQRQDHVVQVAEARRAVRTAMMGAATEAVRDPGLAGPGQARGKHEAAGSNHRTAVHLRIDRIVSDADAVAGLRLRADRLVALGLEQGLDIVRPVITQHLTALGNRGRTVVRLVQPAHRPDQVEGDTHPWHRQRMPGPERGVPVDLAADQDWRNCMKHRRAEALSAGTGCSVVHHRCASPDHGRGIP